MDAGEVLPAACAAVVLAARRIIPLQADPVTDLAFDGADVADRCAIAADLQPASHRYADIEHHH